MDTTMRAGASRVRKERYCGMCEAWFPARVGKECPKCGFDLSPPVVNLMDALTVALDKAVGSGNQAADAERADSTRRSAAHD
jgi:hypothetical protein